MALALLGAPITLSRFTFAQQDWGPHRYTVRLEQALLEKTKLAVGQRGLVALRTQPWSAVLFICAERPSLLKR